ncbi:MAG TPA: transposase [Candidatus Hydrogenedentes bacterium]|nr:transposase [Candidatus Hydrogenedentota bacterium]
MPRVARIVVPGVPHHVTQRGNNQQDIFFVDGDRLAYLELLGAQARRFGLWVEGYCLMTNHIHVVGVPMREDSLAKTMGRTHFLYTHYVNQLHNRSGHLWQNRFYSCAMDDAHALNALYYVELNPVRAGIVRNAWDYTWSSARAHCGKTEDIGLIDLSAWRERTQGMDWEAALRVAAEDKAAQDAVRRSTHTGRPLGTDSCLSKVEHLLGRRVLPLRIGRQKGWRKKKQPSASDQK